jgi:hypothetical protein
VQDLRSGAGPGSLRRLRDLQALLQGEEGPLQEVLRGTLHGLCRSGVLREGLPGSGVLREGLPDLLREGLLREGLLLQGEVLQGEVLQGEVLPLLPSGDGLPQRRVLLP